LKSNIQTITMLKTLISIAVLSISNLSISASYVPIPVYYNISGGGQDPLMGLAFLIVANIVLFIWYLFKTIKWLIIDTSMSYYEYVIWDEEDVNLDTIFFVALNGFALLAWAILIVYNFLQ